MKHLKPKKTTRLGKNSETKATKKINEMNKKVLRIINNNK